MRENRLLSPYRVRQGGAKKHDGRIVTLAPNVMWGTDGARVFTVEDGWVWVFSAVEHGSAECVGWHVCKVGSRLAALEPIAQGLQRIYGSVEAGVARGLSLRMDHGSQYLSDHFQKQIRYWGIAPSFGFVESRRRTAWPSDSTARSRSRRFTVGCSGTSRRCARP